MSNNLKELTRAHHDSAERTEFADMLLSGNIKPKLYQEYLHAQLQNYMVLESAVDIDASLEPIFRSTLMEDDLNELEILYDLDPVEDNFQSVVEYNHHIQTLVEDDKKDELLAHLYVRHFGDAHGGQIIKKQVAHISSGKFYDFENSDAMKMAIRVTLTDDLGDEARVAFEYAIKMMRDLYNGK